MRAIPTESHQQFRIPMSYGPARDYRHFRFLIRERLFDGGRGTIRIPQRIEIGERLFGEEGTGRQTGRIFGSQFLHAESGRLLGVIFKVTFDVM